MEKYDAIIVGAGIAGLGVGGLLQSKGLKTVIFERSTTPGGRCKTFDLPGGWKVDSGTHAVELGEYSACATLLKKLGKSIPWSRNIQGSMMYDENAWKTMDDYLDLTEADKKQMKEFESWMLTLTEADLDELDAVSLTRLLDDKNLSPKIAECMKTIGMVQTTLMNADMISAGEFVSIYRGSLEHATDEATPFDQVRMPLGGIGTMIDAMAEAYQELGGTLRLGEPVRRITVRKGQTTKVETDSATLDAPVVVNAIPIWTMLKVLSMDVMDDLVPEWAARMRSLERETSATMGFTIGTSEPLFTDPFYLSAWRLPNVDLPLQILGHTNFDDTIAPPNHMIAFIGACCMPDQAEDRQFREKTLAAFWELVKQMFPNVEDALVWRRDAHYVGIDGLARSPGMTGKLRPPVHLPEVPGLYFTGDCFTGRGVGMNSAANSAMICSEAILSRQTPSP